MGWIIWLVVLPGCAITAWWIVRGPFRQVVEELRVERARLLFHQRREWLEARFLGALGQVDPIERLRWEDADWLNPIHWARDHQTRRLLALVEVHFPTDPFHDSSAAEAGHATALFEYRKGRWFADGKRLDATRPVEAFTRHCGRFEPVTLPQRRA